MEQAVAGNPPRHGLAFMLAVCLGACSDNHAEESFFSEDINCPTPSIAQFEPWGKSGSQQICKITHGPFVAWEDGYVHLRGSYHNGEKSGVWKWYDRAGKVVKVIDYGK